MNHLLNKIAALALVLTLCLTAVAFAEGDAQTISENLFDMQARVGNKVYSFADTIDGLKEQGIRFEESEYKPGYWYAVNNGRIPFYVEIDAFDRENATAEEIYVCGYRFNAADAPDVELPYGIKLGTATRKSVLETCGTPSSDGGDYLSYRFHRGYIYCYFRFESDAEDAPLKSVEATTSTPYNYGLGVSELAGVDAENLPDPSTFSFDQFIVDGKFYEGKLTVKDLMDNGWRIDRHDQDEELDPQGGKSFIIITTPISMFNGRSMIRVYTFNSAEEGTCTVADADVVSVGVNQADGTSIIVADGITLGSTLDDVIATYGSNYEEEQSDDYVKYTFSMGSTKTSFNVIDNVVVYIEVKTGL